MGAWIETIYAGGLGATVFVAPYVGAWIETSVMQVDTQVNQSHPTWVRGLKLNLCHLRMNIMASHPTWVRGLKPQANPYEAQPVSRTLRGCVD